MNNNVIKTSRDDDHDPMACSLMMEHDVKYNTAVGQITEIMNQYGMTYIDFCNMTMQLDHYYHNWAEINDIDIEEEEFACNAILPSMFQPWIFDDFDDDDD